MRQYLAIVAYRCFVAGSMKGSLDLQVRWFEAADEASVRASIADDPIHAYKNSDDETVSWELSQVIAVEPFAPNASGDEVIGFITSARELSRLAR